MQFDIKAPESVREQIRIAVAALLENEQVRLWSECDYNSHSHLRTAMRSLVYDVVTDILYAEQYDNDLKVRQFIQDGWIILLCDECTDWLATKARERWPATSAGMNDGL